MITKDWPNGDKIYLDIQEDKLVVSSDPNNSTETRQMEIEIVTTNSDTTVNKNLTIIQAGLSE